MLSSKLKIHSPKNIITELSSSLDVRIEVVRCQANNGNGGTSILRIESGPSVREQDIKEWFAQASGCMLLSLLSLSKGRYLATVRNSRCALCDIFVGSDCFLESASSLSDDAIAWRIFTPDNSCLKVLIKRLRQEDVGVELLSIKKATSDFELTPKQDEAIRMAYSLGYFDIPKKITLEELADRSGVSKATLNLILRRGQKKIFAERLELSTGTSGPRAG
jgi:predicted DNA binding protein